MSTRFDSIDDALVTAESSSTGLCNKPRPLAPPPIQRWSNTCAVGDQPTTRYGVAGSEVHTPPKHQSILDRLDSVPLTTFLPALGVDCKLCTPARPNNPRIARWRALRVDATLKTSKRVRGTRGFLHEESSRRTSAPGVVNLPEQLERVDPERPRDLPELDDVKPSFAALVLGNERLRARKSLRKRDLA